MNRSAKHSVSVAQVAVVAIVTVIGIASYRSVSGFLATSGRVEHSHRVIEALGTLMRLTDDAERGQRGYLLTGDEADLALYRQAADGLGQALSGLGGLIDDSGQRQRFEGLRRA
ncbi:CHASE3 domain-containing protein, partial [Singulisphaera rosea]